MKITRTAQIMLVSEIGALTAATSNSFKSELTTALQSTINQIELDLSQAECMDCGGVGALVALRNRARKRNGAVTIRLLNPANAARQMLRLTRMENVFPVELR